MDNNEIVKKSNLRETTFNENAQEIKDIKEKLIAVIKIILGGDKFASEYLLLNLISKIHTRKNELVLGNLCTNLVGVNKT